MLTGATSHGIKPISPRSPEMNRSIVMSVLNEFSFMLSKQNFDANFSSLEISNVNLEALLLCSGIWGVGRGEHLICLQTLISSHLHSVSTKFTTGIAKTEVSNFDRSHAWIVDR